MNISNFMESIDYLVQAELTPFIWGHAGIGKSSIIKQYAQKKGYHFFPFYLGTMSDIGDVLGLADFVRDKQGTAVATKFATPEWLKKAIEYCEQNPQSGAVIFLDEFNRARKDVLNGMFSLALDKTFHTIKLPKNCHVIAAGNPPTDEYFVTDVDETALMARFVHVKLEPTFQEWLDYAKSTKIEPTLIGFLKNQPELLEASRADFQLPVKVDRRSYSHLDRLFKVDTPSHLMEGLMQGIIGIERTVAYQNYLKEAEKPLPGADFLKKESVKLLEKWSDPENVMSSLLNLSCDNFREFLMAKDAEFRLSATEKEALMAILDIIPKDISFPLVKALTTIHKEKTPAWKDFILDPLYEKRIVALVREAKGKHKEEAKDVA